MTSVSTPAPFLVTANKPGKSLTLQHFVAGLGSGIFSALLFQPLDLLKTRVQQRDHISAWSSVRDLMASRGAVRELWRGTVPSVLRTGIGSALYFTSLDHIRRRIPLTILPSDALLNHRTSGLVNLASGATARTFAGFATMPLTVLKARFESSLYAYPSLAAAAGSIYAQGGIAGFFSGFGATAIRDAPYAGFYVFFYELSRSHFGAVTATIASDGPLPAQVTDSAVSIVQAGTQPATINFISGIIAGATCSAISNPFDAAKTRIQLQPHRYRNLVVTCRLMIEQEGVSSLFSGLGLRMCRKALSSALAWTFYEELVRRTTLLTPIS